MIKVSKYQQGTLPIIIIVGLALLMSACSVEQKMARAEAYYSEGRYAKANAIYKKILPRLKPESVIRAYQHWGAGAERIGQWSEAKMALTRATRMQDCPAIVYYQLGRVDQAMGKYEDALKSFMRYDSIVPADSLRSLAWAAACLDQINQNVPTSRYRLNNLERLNTGYDDFCPAFADPSGEKIYFSSNRKEATGKRLSVVSGKKQADLFEAQLQRDGEWTMAQPIEKGINTKDEEAGVAFSGDFASVIVGRSERQGSLWGSALYQYNQTAEGWGEMKRLKIGDTTITILHPSISGDDLELYFASDMPGGMGGYDIWMASRPKTTEGWGDLTHLGSEINTVGNELFPFIRDDGNLYFSSDYHPGYGGLDIFEAIREKTEKKLPGDTTADRAVKKEIIKWSVENMGYPINSQGDDFGVIFFPKQWKGYLSSNRPGGKGGDDLYAFEWPVKNFIMSLMVFDRDVKKALPKTKTVLYTSLGSEIENVTDSTGMLNVPLREDGQYMVVASRPGYFIEKHNFETTNLEGSDTIQIDLGLTSYAKVIEIPGILYDFNKWDLRPEAKEAIDKVIVVMNDNPDITIELSSHTDNKGTAEFNMNLSQKRAQAVVDYMVSKGINTKRLIPKGYGFSKPKVVDEFIVKQYSYLRVGDVLNQALLEKIFSNNPVASEAIDQLNRRTEFKVISTD